MVTSSKNFVFEIMGLNCSVLLLVFFQSLKIFQMIFQICNNVQDGLPSEFAFQVSNIRQGCAGSGNREEEGRGESGEELDGARLLA